MQVQELYLVVELLQVAPQVVRIRITENPGKNPAMADEEENNRTAN